MKKVYFSTGVFLTFIFVSSIVSAQSKKPRLVALTKVPVKEIIGSDKTNYVDSISKRTFILIKSKEERIQPAIYRIYEKVDLPYIREIRVQMRIYFVGQGSGETLYVHSKYDGTKIFISDSILGFNINIEDTFKNLTFFLKQIVYEKQGVDDYFNGSDFHVTQIIRNDLFIKLQFYRSYGPATVIFDVPYQDSSKNEQLVKEKFRFRDVKQVGTRNNGIYLRY